MTSLEKVQTQVDGVVEQMRDNVEKALQHEKKLEKLQIKSEQIEEQARHFEKKATNLRRMMCLRHWKLTLGVTVFILILIAISGGFK